MQRYDAAIAQSKVRPHTLAFILASGLGTHSASTPAGATTARLHYNSPKAQTNKDFETFTVEELYASGTQLKFGGCFTDSFVLEGTRRNFFNLSAQIYGSGKKTTGVASVSEISESSLHVKNAKVWLGTGTYDGNTPTQSKSVENISGSPTVLSSQIESWRWTFNNNTELDFLYPWDSGNTMGRAERMERSQELSATLTFDDSTHIDRLLAQTPVCLQLKCHSSSQQIGSEGYYYGFGLVFPKLMYRRARPQGTAGGRMVYDIVWDVKEDATYGSVRAWVYNIQTGYLQ